MLIPSIDLMSGKIVQLEQGERKMLEFGDFDTWIARFEAFPLVQLIDLDAAMGRGDNSTLVEYFTRRLPCQVGGGIRSIETAQRILSSGAQRVICGSSLIRDGEINTEFAAELAGAVGPDKLVFAVDSKQGKVAVEGWRKLTSLTAAEMITALEPWCSAFLYTHIDTEGLLRGIPLDVVCRLRDVTSKQLIVAGGIANLKEVEQLDKLRIDAVVGMAIYTGLVKV